MATAQNIIDESLKYKGIKESPPNSNNCQFNTEYYGKPVHGAAYPWCAVFLWYVFKHANASALFYGGGKCAYTPTLANYYKQIKRWYSTPKPGDLVFYKFPGSNRINHVGLVIEVISANKIKTIEGNTSLGNNSNGGEVMVRERNTNNVVGYGRPLYSTSSASVPNQKTLYTQAMFIADTQKSLGVDVSGVADKKTLNATVTVSKSKNNRHPVVVSLQKYLKSMGLYTGNVDGIAGPMFDAAVRQFQSTFSKRPDGEFTAKETSWQKILGLI